MKYVLKIRAIHNKTEEKLKFYYRSELIEIRLFLKEFEKDNEIQTMELFKEINNRLIRADNNLLYGSDYDTKKERQLAQIKLIVLILLILSVVAFVLWFLIKIIILVFFSTDIYV